MKRNKFYVYIVTNAKNNVIYTGITNNLHQRIIEHYTKKESGSWDRKKKLQLIKSFSPEFKFLNKELFGEWPPKELTSRYH
jgi:putative endonuclease